MHRFLLIFLFLPLIINAQEKELNNGYKFNDGIYMSFDDFIHSSPQQFTDSVIIYTLTEKMSGLKTGELHIVTKIDVREEGNKSKKIAFEQQKGMYIATDRDDWKSIRLNKVWGIVIDGELFMRTGRYYMKKYDNMTIYSNHNGITVASETPYPVHFKSRTEAFIFNKPTQMGSICLFTLSTSSYSRENFKKKMLNMKTGEMVDVNVYNVRRFIADDRKLNTEFEQEAQNAENAYYYITQYNMRNKTYLPSAEENQQAGERVSE